MEKNKITKNTDKPEDKFAERKQLEETLKDNEEKYSQLIETTDTGYVIIDSQGRVLDTNNEYVRLSGYKKKEEILGKNVIEWTADHSLEKNKQAVQSCIRNGMIRNLEIDYVDKQGKITPVEINATVINTNKGKQILTLCRDITERKHLEHQVGERMKELTALYSLAEITERIGITLDELYQEFTNILPKGWQYPAIACARMVIGDREFRTENFRESAWKQSAPVKVKESVGGMIEVSYLEEKPEEDEGPFLKEERLLIDALAERLGRINERKQLEETKRESEERFRSLFESSRDAIMTIEPPDWNFTSGNPATLEMFKVKSEKEFISYTPGDLSPAKQPDGRPSPKKAKEMIEIAMREGSNFFEWTHKRLTGEDFPANVLLTRVEWAKKQFIQATVRDITESKKADASIRESEEKYSAIFNASADGILIADIETKKFNFANPAICRMLGYSQAELSQMSVMDIHPKKDLPFVLSEFEAQAKNIKTLSENLPCQKKDGSIFYADVNATKFVINGHQYNVGLFRDNTERKKAEEKIKQKNLNLERFNNVSINRELKMIELKNEIKNLKDKLGEK